MKIMKLATGLAVGYVLGARAGRDKYERIVAVAQQATGRSAPAQPSAPVVVPSVPVAVDERPRPPRKRRAKPATPSAAAATQASLGAAEADIAEQKALVVDTRDEPGRSSEALEGDTADVLEQRRSM
ncbi:hypothetical protein [Symbioplanes lichenis]|uniref:hypothetical protein n=1 Tax=Symbioplanes lichenis TaxID=1629072 RepID=UPI00273A2E1F|nr:hypothetical protein [Actinoplanes lichenis]